MAKSLLQILGYKMQTGIIRNPRSGIANVLPGQFLTITKPVTGNMGTYTRIEGTRETARIAQYGAPSRRRELKGVSEVPVTLIHTVEHTFHDVLVLNLLREFDSPVKQARGEAIVRERTDGFAQLFKNLRLAAVYSLLANGAIYFDAEGNLLPSKSGAKQTVDFGVTAGHKNQLGGLIGLWSTAATDIISQVEAVKLAAMKETGYPITTVYYGKSIFGYLAANTTIKGMITGNPAYATAFMEKKIPNGFLELNWIPVGGAMFVDQKGVAQEIFPGDAAIFTPDLSADWYEVLEGTYEVPTNLGEVTADAMAALKLFETVQGQFSYAQVSTDPPGIKHVAGDTFLPTLKVPGAIWIGDTVA